MAQQGLNSTARKQVMQEVHRDLLPIEAQMDELRDKAKQIKARLKDYEIPVSGFNLVRRFIGLEKSKRDELQDTLREGFEALEPGTQHSFLDAMEGKPGVDTAHMAKGDTRDVEVQKFEPGDSFEATPEFQAAITRPAGNVTS